MERNGFVRVAASVPELRVADVEYNLDQIVNICHTQEEAGVDFILFPECALTSYSVSDLYHQETLIQGALKALEELCRLTASLQPTIIVGLPLAVDNKLFNCAAVIEAGVCRGIVPKSFIPNYKEYYEQRWFAPASKLKSTEIFINNAKVPIGTDLIFRSKLNPQLAFGIEICEDLWSPIPPSSYHALAGANIIFNLSASNELIGKADYRKNLVASQSGRSIAAYVLASAGVHESTTDLVFSGHAMIYQDGALLAENERFARLSQTIIADIDVARLCRDRLINTSFDAEDLSEKYREILVGAQNTHWAGPIRQEIVKHPFVPQNEQKRAERCAEIFAIQTAGLMKRIEHCRTKDVVIGLSGGLDSTLALLVCIKSFDILGYSRKNIRGITMPGFGTTGRTYSNVNKLAEKLQIDLSEIEITGACLKHFSDIGHDPEIHDVVYENVQARERTQLLMDRANQLNGLVIGTGDMSELALGWCTYNGDHISMYNVNGGVPKTLVKYLIEWVSDSNTVSDIQEVLEDILDTPISPELLPPDENGEISQKTEDTVGPYELHDFFLYHAVRLGERPAKIKTLANQAYAGSYSPATIELWLTKFYQRFFSQQFKRSCLPDGPKVGTVSLSPRGDWRMPSDALPSLWLKDLDD